MVEVQALKSKKDIEKIKKAFTNKRDLMLFVLGINVGLRISDLLNLKVVDVLDKETVTIKEGKTNKTREFTINTAAKTAIMDYINSLDGYTKEDYLFKSRKGDNKPISRVEAWQVLNNAAEKAKVKIDIGTHTLRKTFGYWSYKQGIDITLLQKIFNHSSPAITLRYIGITQDDIKNVYNNLNL